MRFDKLDQRAVGIFDVGEMAGSFAHVEGVAFGAAVDREGVPPVGADDAQGIHAHDVEAEVNEAEIAPKAVLEDLAGRAVGHLDQFDHRAPQHAAERPLARIGMRERHAAEVVLSARQAGQIAELPAFVVQHLVVAQDARIHAAGPFDIADADRGAVDTTGQVACLVKPIVGRNYLQQIAVGVLQEEMQLPIGAGGRTPEQVELGGAEFLVSGGHVAGFELGDRQAQIAELNIESSRLWSAAGVLPDLESAAALGVDRQHGVAFLWLVVGVGQHQVGFGRFVEDRDVHSEVPAVPGPGVVHARNADTHLLNAADDGFLHIVCLVEIGTDAGCRPASVERSSVQRRRRRPTAACS